MSKSAWKKKLVVPVGRAVYTELRKDHCAYADKTALIPVLEGLCSNAPLVLRPRRFGRTLFVSMLETYYDCAQKEDFEKNFSGTYIYDHKTPQQGQYFILHLDCSGIEVDQAAPRFLNYVKGALRYFLDYYQIEEREAFLSRAFTSPAELLDRFCQDFQDTLGKRSVFLLIDEYDQFANEILAVDSASAERMTAVPAFLKNFYSVIKSYAGTVFGRIYMTGGLPISLDSFVSGFNIATNYSAHPAFADAFGLTEDELRQVIRDTVDLERFGGTEEALFTRMKELYGGYRFSRDSEASVFHASMCMEYLRIICENKREPRGAEVLDPSAVNVSELRRILMLGDARFVRDVVDRCVMGQTIPCVELSRTINFDQKDKLDSKVLLTVLFCRGYLTFAPGKAKALVCPNKTIQEQFFGYYFKYLSGFGSVSFDEDAIDVAGKALSKGDAEPFFRYVETCLKSDVGLHGRLQLVEAPIQYFILGAARSLRGFKTTAEDEARGVGYTDILIEPIADSAIKYTYLVELKYLTKEAGTPAAVAQKAKEARQQLNSYAATASFKDLTGLKKVAVVFVGSEIKSLQYV